MGWLLFGALLVLVGIGMVFGPWGIALVIGAVLMLAAAAHLQEKEREKAILRRFEHRQQEQERWRLENMTNEELEEEARIASLTDEEYEAEFGDDNDASEEEPDDANSPALTGDLSATLEHDEAGHDLAHRFTQVMQWRERVGSPAWRRRAARELSPTEHEAFLFYASALKELSPTEHEAIRHEWERFNAARAKAFERSNIRAFLSALFLGAGGFGLFFVAMSLILQVSMADVTASVLDALGMWGALWIGLHVIGIIWLIICIVRGIASGLVFTPEPDKRSAEEIAWARSYNRLDIIFSFVFFLGLNEILDAISPPSVEHPIFVMPLWLAIPLTLLSVYGFFHLGRLRDLRGDRVDSRK